MKIGLVLEGGGMRGLYTAGVLDFLMDKGFKADVICGTSAGVTFGINLPSAQKGRVLRYNTRFAGDRRYISLHSFLTSGNMVNTDFAYGLLPDVLDPFDYEAFRTSGTEFYATVTNCLTGQPEYLRLEDCKSQMDIIRASASLPFLSRKVYIDGVPYLDGGISDNIPLDKCFETGCDKVIVVLTHPADYVKNESLYWLSRFVYPFSKGLQDAFKRRCDSYNACLGRIRDLEAAGRIFVMRPSEHLEVGRLESDPEILSAMHALGLKDAEASYKSLTEYLAR